MNRRDLIKSIAVITGGVFIGGELFLTGCKSGPKAAAGFSAGNIALLDEVGETILPATKSPGAKAAKAAILAYTDDDTAPDPNWVYRIFEVFRKEEIVAMTGLVLAAWRSLSGSPPRR